MPDAADVAGALGARTFTDAELSVAQVPTSKRTPGRMFRWGRALYEVVELDDAGQVVARPIGA